MVEISMQAALLIYMISFILGSIIMLINRLNNKSLAVDLFLLFYVISTIGSALIFFRVEINNLFISVIVANFLLISGVILLVYGIVLLLKQKPNHLLTIFIIIAYFVSFTYYTYINVNVIARVIIFNIISILILLRALIHLFKFERKSITKVDLLTPSIIILVLSISYRLLGILIFSETATDFLMFQRDSLSVAVLGVSYLLVLVGLFSMLSHIANESLMESEQSKTRLISNLPGFAFRCKNDDNWTLEFLSEGFESITGYNIDKIIREKHITFFDIISDEFITQVKKAWNNSLKNNSHFNEEYQITCKNGEKIWVWEQSVGKYNESGECIEIEGFISNINSRKRLEENLEFLSYRDSLTSLYNRRYIEEQLTRLEASRNLPISILVADINGLKFINDSFGHAHGDEVIQKTADALRRSLREYELIARLGGDEFLIILENTSSGDSKKIVQRIQTEIGKEEYVDLGSSLAVGYATKESNDTSLQEIRKIAEDNMYRQKIYSKPSTRRKAVDAVVKTLYEKDNLSEVHSQSVAKYSTLLAKELGLSESKIRQVETAALLHDVGKIVINDDILKSTKELTKAEYEQMKKHPEIGYRILNSVPELSDTADIILAHHERIDGLGYPNGLRGEEIPLLSKIISICDAYDAMINIRLYKPRYSKEQAIQELLSNKGTQFDSDLVDQFIKIIS